VYKSSVEFASIGVPNDIVITVGRGQAASLTTAAKLTKEPLIAPLAAGQTVGELTVTDSNGQVVARSPLVPLTAVPEGGMWTRAVDDVRLWFH
jgi:D-alanyl-D-alanine carboxypeptidase (penicillin-binding protein 5/6)